jgi:hypothetical protein
MFLRLGDGPLRYHGAATLTPAAEPYRWTLISPVPFSKSFDWAA